MLQPLLIQIACRVHSVGILSYQSCLRRIQRHTAYNPAVHTHLDIFPVHTANRKLDLLRAGMFQANSDCTRWLPMTTTVLHRNQRNLQKGSPHPTLSPLFLAGKRCKCFPRMRPLRTNIDLRHSFNTLPLKPLHSNCCSTFRWDNSCTQPFSTQVGTVQHHMANSSTLRPGRHGLEHRPRM
jgi:hypothetical protein